MARTDSRAARNYAAGTYGPFQVDQFTSADTDWLELRFSVEPGSPWPTNDRLIAGQMRWSNGDGADFTILSPPRNRNGTLATSASVRVYVPQNADGKAAVNSGTVSMTLEQTVRTAISLTAGAG